MATYKKNRESKALELFQSLDKEQVNFVKLRKIEASYKIKHWIDFFEKISFMDEKGDGERKKWEKWRTASIIVAVLFFIFGFANYFLFVFTFIAIIGIFIFSNFVAKLKSIDVKNQLRLFIFPLLSFLKEEIDQEQKVYLHLDLSQINQEAYLKETIPVKSSALPKILTKIYELNWIKASMQMVDGTDIEWEITDKVRIRNITKRGSSGKIKYKTKIKTKHTIILTSSFSKSKYTCIANPTEISPKSDSSNWVLRQKNKLVSLALDEVFQLEKLLEPIGNCYRKVKPL